MCGRVLISVCVVASVVLAYPQDGGWQNGQQQQSQGYGANNGDTGYGANGAAGNGGGRQLQPNQQEQQPPMKPMNYDFQWEVDDEESSNYYGHKEQADNGRVDGSYHVWLPDGRLMKVTYYVDGNSGFVPTITYEKAFTPTWGNSYFNQRRRR